MATAKLQSANAQLRDGLRKDVLPSTYDVKASSKDDEPNSWTIWTNVNVKDDNVVLELKPAIDAEALPANGEFTVDKGTGAVWITLNPDWNDEIVALSTGEVCVKASSATEQSKLWFQTEPLDAKQAKGIVTVRLDTESHDQGWADAPKQGEWSWFTVVVTGADGKVKLNKFSHANKPQDTNYQRLQGTPIDVQGHLTKGDVIAVYANAQYTNWANYGKSAQLNLLPK